MNKGGCYPYISDDNKGPKSRAGIVNNEDNESHKKGDACRNKYVPFNDCHFISTSGCVSGTSMVLTAMGEGYLSSISSVSFRAALKA